MYQLKNTRTIEGGWSGKSLKRGGAKEKVTVTLQSKRQSPGSPGGFSGDWGGAATE